MSASRTGSRSPADELTRMIKDLEVQLDRMIGINEALESDLDRERRRASELERRNSSLALQLQRAEEELAGRDDLMAELAHVKDERNRLANDLDGAKAKLEEAAASNAKHAATVDRLRAGRDDALDELKTVEEQFERAMKMAAGLQARLSVLGEEYAALRGRARITEETLRSVERERDELLAEVEESRLALEDIRRSLVDACVVSQQTGTRDPDNG